MALDEKLYEGEFNLPSEVQTAPLVTEAPKATPLNQQPDAKVVQVAPEGTPEAPEAPPSIDPIATPKGLPALPQVKLRESAPVLPKETSGPPAPSPEAPKPSHTIRSLIHEEADKGGVSRDYMERMAQIESSFNPGAKAKGSTAKGLFQFIDDTWAKEGSGDVYDARANTQAAVRLTLKNKQGLQSALGRPPEDWELYAAHQQGLGGAKALMQNPQARAIDVLTPLYKGGQETATRAIVNNGGNANMSAGEFLGLWKAKWSGAKVSSSKADAPYSAPLPNLFSDDQLHAGYRSTDPMSRDYSFLEGMSAALRNETVTGLMLDRIGAPTFKPDDFKWSKELVDTKLADLPVREQTYIRETAVSEAHIDFLRTKALDRLDGDKAIAAQGLVGGLAVMIGAGAVDLPGLIAGGFAGKAIMAGRQLSMMSRVSAQAGVFAASAVPLEATKVALNPSYDAGDAVHGIAMAALFGGGFGALGAGGGKIAGKYREFADGAVRRVSEFDEAAVAARKAEYAESTAGAMRTTDPFQNSAVKPLTPTWMDRAAVKASKWADFSVGGRLYYSENEAISELSTKLTTVATQRLTQGARIEEGAIDFVQRQTAGMNSRVAGSLQKNFNGWADEQGLNALTRHKELEKFYDQAQRVHTDPGMQGVEVNPHVQAFVDDMREGFSDFLDLAKSYGLKSVEKLEPDQFYLPRYPNKVQWEAYKAKHDIEGLEDLVQAAIKDGDPGLAKRVGSRIVERAAKKDAQGAVTPEMEASIKANAEARANQSIAEARITHEGELEVSIGDFESGKAALADVKAGKEVHSVTLENLKSAADEEVAKWQGIAKDIRASADELKSPKNGTTGAKEMVARKKAGLIKEAEEVEQFAGELHYGVAESFLVSLKEFLGRPLTFAEKQAVYSYTGNGYKDLNASLRGLSPSTSYHQKMAADLDTAVTSDALKAPEKLYRGVRLDTQATEAKFGNMKVGDIYDEAAFFSSSRSKQTSSSFGGDRGVVFEFEAPQGALHAAGHKGESEVVFPRGTKLQITATRQEGKRTIHTAKMVDPQMAPVATGEGLKLAEGGLSKSGGEAIEGGLKTRKGDAQAAARAKRDAAIKEAGVQAEAEVDVIKTAIKSRAFQESFDKHLGQYEEKFTRRMARNYVKSMDDDVTGRMVDVDSSLSIRDTDRLREALRAKGVVIDEDQAEAMADMLAPRAQRGPANLRKRTTLNENLDFTPHGSDRSYTLRDLMEKDYEVIMDRYTRSISPAIIMNEHGFTSEGAVRKHINQVTRDQIGIEGYSQQKAEMDERRANYLVDAIYGRYTGNASLNARAIGQSIRNINTIRLGGSFGMAQTYDAINLPLRYGFDTMRKVMPAFDEMAQVVKRGGPEADALIREMQIFAGVGVKGQESRIMVPNFNGLDRALDQDLSSNMIRKMQRLTKSGSNAISTASGLNALTDLQHYMASRAYLQTILDVHLGVKVGDPRRMASMGLDEANLKKFGSLLENATVNKQGVIQDLNVDLLKQIDFKTFDNMMGLMRRDAFTAILEPHAGLKPMWMGNSEMGKFFGQLKSFAFASHAVHTLGNLHLGTTYAGTALVGGAAWGSLMYFMWTHAGAVGRPDREEYLEKYLSLQNPDKLAAAIWDRSGVSGITPMILGGMMEGAEFLGVKEKDTTGGWNSNARASGLAAGGLKSVPTFDLAFSIADGLATGVRNLKGENLTQKEFNGLKKLIPYQNGLGMRQFLNKVQGQFEESK